MNKKIVILIIGFLWIAVAVGVIASKQYTLRTGTDVLLETVPVDPRDFLRGDYVILRYKISTLDLNKIKSEMQYYRQGKTVFVKIEPGKRFWEAVAVGTKKGIYGEGVYLRGQVKYGYNRRLDLNYGIESYFVPEGEGKDIEKNMRGNKSSVEVEIIIDSLGNALIKKVYLNRGG
jgi:uncharacterized membrane-anchored protein